MMITYRLFVALPLPAPVAADLAAYGAACAKLAPGAKADAEKNLHVTVRFLGDVDARVVTDLSAALARALAAHASFFMPFVGVRLAPPQAPGRMVWAEYGGGAAFASLARAADEAAGAFIALPPAKERIAHVTLVRAKAAPLGGPLPAFDVEVPPLSVGEAVLYSSILGPKGPSYAEIARFPLGGR